MISLIIPVYNEEKNLLVLQSQIEQALGHYAGGFEVVYVNDGSNDSSMGVLRAIRSASLCVKVVEFARHFGQTEAMQAGIDHSSGEILVFLDADLQNDPQDIPRLLSKLNEGFDVVSGWRKNRKDAFFLRKMPSFLANVLFARISGVQLHDLGCTLKAYRKDVLKDIRLYGEMHRLIPVYAAKQGARIAEIEVTHRPRVAGRSKYGLRRVFRVILDFFVADFMNSYLSKPMYVFGGYGLSLMFFAAGLGVFIAARKVLWGGEWVSPLLFILLMLVIVSVQLILMGLIAEIMIRLYYERENIWTYIVREKK